MSIVSEYYERDIQHEFASAINGAAADVLAQPPFTATYEVTGEGGATYGLRITDGRLEVIPGGIANSDMYVSADVAEWSEGKDAGMANPFDYYRKRKVNLIKSFRGRVNLDLTREEGENLEGVIVFGGADEPAVVLRMKDTDYLAMMNGKLNGQMAFMTGKLKFDGSLPLLMQVGALNS